MSLIPTLTSASLDDLRSALRGRLHLPGDDGYDRLGGAWNVAVPLRAAAVAEVADAADVQTVVTFAHAAGLRVAVRATGHGASSDLAGELLVQTSRLDELTVHPEGWARIGAGVKWGRVLEAAAPHGLAPLVGSAPDVGVVGYLTGGGLGPLARSFGLSSDSVRAFDVVTGDGEHRRATATEHPDLFWALKGGKGALGIVTAVEIDLLHLPTVYGGSLFFDGSDTADVVTRWAAWTRGLDRRASTSLAVNRLPALPSIPAPLAGRQTVAVRFAWTGDPAEGEQVLADLSSVGEPLFGGVGVMPYSAIGMIHSDPVDPMPTHERFSLLAGLPADAVAALVAATGPSSSSVQVVTELRMLGGALAEHHTDSGALAPLGDGFTLFTVGIAAGPLAEATAADAAAIHAALAPWATGRQLPNFAPSDSADHLRLVYDEGTLRRLCILVNAYDPCGVMATAVPLRAAQAAVAGGDA